MKATLALFVALVALITALSVSIMVLLERQTRAMQEAVAYLSAEAHFGEEEAAWSTLHRASLAPLRDFLWGLDEEGVEGAWLEVGAWRGGVTAAAASAFQSSKFKRPRHVAMADYWRLEDPPAFAHITQPILLKGDAAETLPACEELKACGVAAAWLDVGSAEEVGRVLPHLLALMKSPGASLIVPLTDEAALRHLWRCLGKPDTLLSDLAVVWRVQPRHTK